MKKFVDMQEHDLLDVDGGIGVLEIVFGVIGVYGVIREMVKEQGAADAYEDLAAMQN